MHFKNKMAQLLCLQKEALRREIVNKIMLDSLNDVLRFVYPVSKSFKTIIHNPIYPKQSQ